MVSKSELEKLLDELLEDKVCNRNPDELGKDVLSLGKKNLLLLLTKSLCVIEKQMDDIVSVQQLAKHYNLQLVNKTIERNASSIMWMKDFQERNAKEKRERFPYQDSDLERLYTFLRFLSPKLPKRTTGQRYSFDDEVRLEYYRLQKISEGSISLRDDGKAEPLDGPREVGSGARHHEDVPLSSLIDVINERFGTDFTDADQLFFDQIIEAAIEDSSLREAAAVNPEEKFALLFAGLLETLFIERMEQNEDVFARFMNEKDFQSLVSEWISRKVYSRFRSKSEVG